MKYIAGIILLLVAFCAVTVSIYNHREKKWYSGGHIENTIPQYDSISTVFILGTIHNPVDSFNADTVFNILQRFRPDIILTEVDTFLFERYLDKYDRKKLSLFAKIKQVFRPREVDDNETRAVRKYKYQYPSIQIAPYDYEGRNAFHQKHNILTMPDTVLTAIEKLSSQRKLLPSHDGIWKYWGRINDTLNSYYTASPYTINNNYLYRLTERRQVLQYEKMNEIVQQDTSLKRYRSFYEINTRFWHERNQTMALNILRYIQQFPKKRIMVLTGFMHKYYLLNQLEPEQERNKFRLLEYR